MRDLSQEFIQVFNFDVKAYDGITKLIVQTKQRLLSSNLDKVVGLDKTVIELTKIKDRIGRGIGRNLESFPVWNEWLKGVPGIGPWIGGKLMMLYYYRFVPVCTKCETVLEKRKGKNEGDKGTYFCTTCDKSVKGEGNLRFTVETKDFSRISSWWHYMGRHVEDGKVPKRKSGMQVDWSTEGRTLGFHIADQFVKGTNGNLYRALYDEKRRKREKTHPDATKAHKYNMARNEAVKIFLAHFWTVARTLDGLSVTEPYAMSLGGSHNYIAPFYWERDGEEGEPEPL